MRIKTHNFVLTFHGNTSALELDLSKDQPQLIVPTEDIQVSLEQVTSAPSTHTKAFNDQLTNAFAKTLIVFKNENFASLSDQLKEKQNGLQNTASVDNTIKNKKSEKSLSPEVIRNQDWFKELSSNELLAFFDTTNALSIADSIRKYQKVNHLVATLSFFKDNLIPTQTVVKRIVNRFKAQQPNIEKNCIQVPLALNLIKKVDFLAGQKTHKNHDLYSITSLGQEVLSKLIGYMNEKQEQFQQKRSSFIAKSLGQDVLLKLVDYMNGEQEQLQQKRNNFIETVLKDKK